MADPEEKSSFSSFLDAASQVVADHWKSVALVLAGATAGGVAVSKGLKVPFVKR